MTTSLLDHSTERPKPILGCSVEGLVIEAFVLNDRLMIKAGELVIFDGLLSGESISSCSGVLFHLLGSIEGNGGMYPIDSLMSAIRNACGVRQCGPAEQKFTVCNQLTVCAHGLSVSCLTASGHKGPCVGFCPLCTSRLFERMDRAEEVLSRVKHDLADLWRVIDRLPSERVALFVDRTRFRAGQVLRRLSDAVRPC